MLEPVIAPMQRGYGSPSDDSTLLTEALQAHGVSNKLIEKLISFAIAPKPQNPKTPKPLEIVEEHTDLKELGIN